MWPWEHLAVGYLCYSLAVHLVARRRPSGWPVVALAVGTQFPDLVDKPLAWSLGVLPSGHSLAHSLLVALPVALLAVSVGVAVGRASGRPAARESGGADEHASASRREGDHEGGSAVERTDQRLSVRARVGIAFAFGYLSHLPGDVFYPVLVGSEPNYDFLLWPLVPAADSEVSVGFVEMFRTLFGRYAAELATGELGVYLAVELGLLASVFALWLFDGTPPLRSVWSRVVPGREAEETTNSPRSQQ